MMLRFRADRNMRTLAALLASLALSFMARSANAEWPSLEKAIELARNRSLAVSDARGELGVAKANMVGARVSALGNPYTDIQIDRGSDTGIIQALSYTYFPIDMFGQRGARIEEADKMLEWRKLGLVDARAQATGDVVAAYGEITVNIARVNETVRGEQTAREEAKYFAGRLAAKDTTVYEKALADAEVARWVQNHAEAVLRLTGSRATFGQLTGIGNVTVPSETTAIAPPPLRGSWDDAYVAKMIQKSPTVARLVSEQVYWDASVDRYKAERRPPISLELIGGRGSAGEARYGGGLTFTFPITRLFQGEIARAEAGRLQAQSRAELFQNILEARLKGARDAVRSVETTLEELDKNGMPALETAVSASVEAYKLGKIELTRVLLARRDLSIARSRRLDLLEMAWRAYSDLTTLSGELP